MINFTGHSGCKVILLEKNIVRKISSNLFYNSRLEIQMQKQLSFKDDFFKKPIIIDYGYNKDNLFYFDMEYISGINLSLYFENNSAYNCIKIINKFEKFKKQTFIDIKDDIQKKIKNLNIEDIYINLFDIDWKTNDGYCHGDLTFENIIVNDGGIYLIDFLDSFSNCPLVDESKLLQDAFCYWSFKNNYIPKEKLSFICEKYNTKQHYIMLLIHLYRILPYTNEKEKILCMTQKVIKKIKKL